MAQGGKTLWKINARESSYGTRPKVFFSPNSKSLEDLSKEIIKISFLAKYPVGLFFEKLPSH